MNTCCFSLCASRPDLIRGRLFGICLFFVFLIFLFLLTVNRAKVGAPLWPLLTQGLPRLQAGLLKPHLLPIAQTWAAVRAGRPCRGWGDRGVRTHTQTLRSHESLCPVCVEVTQWGSQGDSQVSVAEGEGRGQELDVVVMLKGQRSGYKVIAMKDRGREGSSEG